MKEALDLVSACLADTGAPVPTSRMIRVSRGRMTGYGGEVAVSAPVKADFEGALFTDRLKEFYSRPRAGERFIVKDNVLSIKAGYRTALFHLAINADLPFLDVIGPVTALSIPWNDDKIKQLKTVASLCDPLADNTFVQGITFADESVYATNGKIIFAGASGLPETVRATVTLKAFNVVMRAAANTQLSGIKFDEGSALAFIFADGTHVICRYIPANVPGQISEYFESGNNEPYLKITETAHEEMVKAKECTWLGIPGSSTLFQGKYEDATYIALGSIDNAVVHNSPTPFMFASEVINFGLSLTDEFQLHRPRFAPTNSKSSWVLLAFGDDYAAVCSGRTDRNSDNFKHAIDEHV